MPAEWALARPSAIWVARWISLFVGIGPPIRISRSVWPSTYSMAM